MIEYHEPGFVCCNSLNPCEKHEKKPAAQSDAPSAEAFSGSDAKAWWWENVKSSPFKMTPERIWAHCEAYAALRTAQQDSQLKLTRVELKQSCEERERLLATERAKVAQLERERELITAPSFICGLLYGMEKPFVGGCGKPILQHESYRCADCTAAFHRECAREHFEGDALITALRDKANKELIAGWKADVAAAESSLSEARERAQALADWLEWKQRHSAERAQQCGEQGSDQLKTFNLGMVDCVQNVIQTDEYRQLRQLLAGASGAAGKGGADAS